MFIEIKRLGKKRKYYLAHSFRDKGKVKKLRRYLGENLSKEELDKLRRRAEYLLSEKFKSQKSIKDPYKDILSKEEIKELKKLELKVPIKVLHLSNKQWQKFSELFTYDTNAIEGSTLLEGEVVDIIEKNKWPENAEKWEISETYGVVEAINHIRKVEEHISLKLIKELHNIVFKNSKTFAGNLRKFGIEVVIKDKLGNIVHRGAPSSQVAELLGKLTKWYNKFKKKYPPLVLAVIVHNQFETIHPFQDGNGRVGRLLMNNILLKNKLPPVNIELKKRFEYYSALQAYQNQGKIRPMIDLILKEYNELKKKLETKK